MRTQMIRHSAFVLLLSVSCMAQGAGNGSPYNVTPPYYGGTSISGTSLINGCTPGTTPDCIMVYSGIPGNATLGGSPNGTVSQGLAYSSHTAIPGFSTNRQRAQDVYLPNGTTSLTTGPKECVVFFQGGAGISTVPNSPMILPTSGGSCPVGSGVPATFWQATDPGHNNGTLGKKVFVVNYGLSATGTVTGSGSGGAVLSTDTTLTVTIPANRWWPANGDTPYQLQMETEQATVTAQTGSGAGSTVTLTVTRGTNGTTAAAHASGLPGWVLTSIANGAVSTNSPLDLWDGACFFASAIANGYCTSFDVFGESHGGGMGLSFAQSTPTQRAGWLTSGNCEYSSTNWQILNTTAIEPPTAQDGVAVLASDGTEPGSNAASFGGVSGYPSGAINTNTALWANYGSTTCTGGGGVTVVSRTNLGTYAYGISPRSSIPSPTPKIMASVGNADTDVCTNLVQDYVTAAVVPFVEVSGNHGGDLGSCGQAWNPASLMLKQFLANAGIPDGTYGVVGKGTAGGSVEGNGTD